MTSWKLLTAEIDGEEKNVIIEYAKYYAEATTAEEKQEIAQKLDDILVERFGEEAGKGKYWLQKIETSTIENPFPVDSMPQIIDSEQEKQPATITESKGAKIKRIAVVVLALVGVLTILQKIGK